jgi:hypothetical protein
MGALGIAVSADSVALAAVGPSGAGPASLGGTAVGIVWYRSRFEVSQPKSSVKATNDVPTISRIPTSGLVGANQSSR